MKLTKKEEAWLQRFYKCMEAAPDSLDAKLSSYTIGDAEITLYDKVKFSDYLSRNGNEDLEVVKELCQIVTMSDSEVCAVRFPFGVEATSD